MISREFNVALYPSEVTSKIPPGPFFKMLKIEFANPKGDIHLVLRDNCRVCILYMNVYSFEKFCLKENEKFNLHCPICSREYILQRDEYEKAYEEYCTSESKKWAEFMK